MTAFQISHASSIQQIAGTSLPLEEQAGA